MPDDPSLSSLKVEDGLGSMLQAFLQASRTLAMREKVHHQKYWYKLSDDQTCPEPALRIALARTCFDERRSFPPNTGLQSLLTTGKASPSILDRREVGATKQRSSPSFELPKVWVTMSRVVAFSPTKYRTLG